MWHRAHTALLARVVCAEQSGREGTILPFCSHHRTAATSVHSRSRSFAPFLFCHVQCGHPPVQGSARRESPIKAPFVGGFGAVCVCVCILPPPFCPLRFFLFLERSLPSRVTLSVLPLPCRSNSTASAFFLFCESVFTGRKAGVNVRGEFRRKK